MSFLKLRALPLALAAACAAAGPSFPRNNQFAQIDVDVLKVLYLECTRRSEQERLDLGDAMQCSLVHEELLQRGFDGRFERLLAWWQEHKATVAAAAQPESEPLPTP